MSRHPRRIAASASVALLSLSLVACGTPSTPGEAATPTPLSSTPIDSPPATTPDEQVILISLDGISVDEASAVGFDAPDVLVSRLSDALGADPTEEPVEGPYGDVYTAYVWEGVRAVLRTSRIDISVTAETPRASFLTEEGIHLGSTRAEALAAGAEDGWDEDSDGIADYLNVGMREVPGTSSLVNPGEVGVEYLSLTIVDDVVVEITSGGNDFSDI